MNKIKNLCKAEFINNTKPFDWIFMGIGLLLQIVAIIISAVQGNDPYIIITAISGITGVISVVLCSRGKLSQYLFGYIQLFTYVFGVAIPLALWGEVIENFFYMATMLIGVIIWIKKYKNNNEEIAVETKEMSKKAWVLSIIGMIIAVIGVAYLLPKLSIWFPTIFTETDPFPLLDSITTVIPLFGQMLMCFRYKDQWVFWFVEDVMSLVMFALAGNIIMVAQYIFWTANCIYGWIKWSKLVKR